MMNKGNNREESSPLFLLFIIKLKLKYATNGFYY